MIFENAFVAFFAALGAIWQAHPIKTILLSFFLASIITELYWPTFTEVLSTHSETHLSNKLPYFDIEASIASKMAFALDSSNLHMSRNLVTTLFWFMSKILTVTGFIFSSPWSLLPSVTMLKQLVFIWLTSIFCNSGARLRMHEALFFPQAHAFGIFESGKMFLNNGPKWSAVANGKLCSARKQVPLTSAALTCLSRFIVFTTFKISKHPTFP